jgi:hypothetical protein
MMVTKDRPRKKYPSDRTDSHGPSWNRCSRLPSGAHEEGALGRWIGGKSSIPCSTSTAAAANGICCHTICCPRARGMTTLSSGATTGPGLWWSRPCASGLAWPRGANPPPALRASIVKWSRPPRWEATSAGMMAARTSRGTSAMCWSIH